MCSDRFEEPLCDLYHQMRKTSSKKMKRNEEHQLLFFCLSTVKSSSNLGTNPKPMFNSLSWTQKKEGTKWVKHSAPTFLRSGSERLIRRLAPVGFEKDSADVHRRRKNFTVFTHRDGGRGGGVELEHLRPAVSAARSEPPR